MGAPITIKLLETSTDGGKSALHVMDLVFETTRITVRDLVAARVTEEYDLARLNEPTSQELEGQSAIGINEHGLEKEIEKALEQFTAMAYFIFVSGRQIKSLDESIVLTDQLEVEYIRLVPLAGG